MNGTHRPQGIFVASGDLAAASGLERSASIVDVAPTLLAAMGVEWEEPLDGACLLPPRCYDAEEESLVTARLRALGYLE